MDPETLVPSFDTSQKRGNQFLCREATMSESGRMPRKASFSTDALIVPDPLSHLKALRSTGDRPSLYQAIVVGGSFIEGFGMLWFKKADAKGFEFH